MSFLVLQSFWRGRQRELVLVALRLLRLLFFRCLVTVNVLKLFLTVSWMGLQFVIVVISDHTHLLFGTIQYNTIQRALFFTQVIT